MKVITVRKSKGRIHKFTHDTGGKITFRTNQEMSSNLTHDVPVQKCMDSSVIIE